MSSDLSQPTLPPPKANAKLYVRLALGVVIALLIIAGIVRVVMVAQTSHRRFDLLMNTAIPTNKSFLTCLYNGDGQATRKLLCRSLRDEWTAESLTKMLKEHPEFRRPKNTLGFYYKGNVGINLWEVLGLTPPDGEQLYIFRHQLLDAANNPAGELKIWIVMEGNQAVVQKMTIDDKVLLAK